MLQARLSRAQSWGRKPCGVARSQIQSEARGQDFTCLTFAEIGEIWMRYGKLAQEMVIIILKLAPRTVSTEQNRSERGKSVPIGSRPALKQ